MQTKKFLIVDDDSGTRHLLTKWLQNAGYAVLEASNGEEAFCLAKHNTFDFIVMDIMLPDMDGPETIRRIQKEGISPKARILFISSIALSPGDAAQSGNEEQISVDGKDYPALMKPLEPKVFLNAIEALENA